MGSALSFVTRVYTSFSPAKVALNPDHLQIGILSTGDLAALSLITPAKSHRDIVVYAVASRDEEKAKKFAKKHGIYQAFYGKNAYRDLIEDPRIDAVYIPLPNSMHYEWTIKALKAGKHVLVEKPIASTPEEAREMHELADSLNLVLLEGIHTRFHPALQRVKAIVDSGELGKIKHMSAKGLAPIQKADQVYKPSDFEQAKGSVMDIACYDVDIFRYLTGSEPTGVGSVAYTPSPKAKNMDKTADGVLEFPGEVTAAFSTDIALEIKLGFIPQFDFSLVVECEEGSINLSNYMIPQIYHSLTVTKSNGQKRVEKVYKPASGSGAHGEEWWSTFRYQLKAFVQKIRGGSPPEWVKKEDSVAILVWLQKIYEKVNARLSYNFLVSSTDPYILRGNAMQRVLTGQRASCTVFDSQKR
ncbi:NAD(P)-binding protein [Agrocybe pediades]|nr:NAD(P)-binding protein [Agrocybe pediades]